jgi:hypothetical protein
MHCACHDWTRQGTEGFLGHKVCQGPDTWLQSEASRGALILMGVWCVATRRSTSQPLKTRVHASWQVGRETPGDIPQRKRQKGV